MEYIPIVIPIVLACICIYIAYRFGVFVDRVKDETEKKNNTIPSDDEATPDIVFLCYPIKKERESSKNKQFH